MNFKNVACVYLCVDIEERMQSYYMNDEVRVPYAFPINQGSASNSNGSSSSTIIKPLTTSAQKDKGRYDGDPDGPLNAVDVAPAQPISIITTMKLTLNEKNDVSSISPLLGSPPKDEVL